MERSYVIFQTDPHMDGEPERHVVAVCETSEVADAWIRDYMRSIISGQVELLGHVIMQYPAWQIQSMFDSFEVEGVDYYDYGSI